jgi:IS30 family transposase
MAQIGRPGLSSVQKRELWQRWRNGQSLSDIGRALGKHPGSVHCVIKANGGIVPAQRTRSVRVLSLAEREEISRGIAMGESIRQVAKRIGRAPSTVSREITRHGGRRKYRAANADDRAWRNAKRPKLCLLARNVLLQRLVAEKLREDWSPEQICGWLALHHQDDPSLRVSHETIYRSLFIQARGVLRKELISHLRRVRSMRSSINATRAGQGRGGITDAVSIRDRPAEVEDRAVPGHWEGDLIKGSANSHVATLVERHSRFVMLIKVEGKDTASVVGALNRQIQALPRELMTSLTWDRGTELASHKAFTVATDATVYFCDPRSPWQRGSNENTNGLLRQYLPKGTDLSAHSQDALDAIALRLNTRPRKTLGFTTPAAKLGQAVAATG